VFRGGRPSLLTPLKFGFKIGFWGQYGRDGANRSGFFMPTKKPRPKTNRAQHIDSSHDAMEATKIEVCVDSYKNFSG